LSKKTVRGFSLRAGGADAGEMAQVAVVQIQEIGRCGGGLQHRDRLPPMIAFGLTDGKTMQGGEAGEGPGGDKGAARGIVFVAGKLGPEGRLQPQILAHRHSADVGQGRHALCRCSVQRRQIAGPDQHRHMMFAQGRSSRRQIIARFDEPPAQRRGFVVGGAEATQRRRNPFLSDLTVDEGEAFAEHHFERQTQQAVQHARRSLGRVFLQRQDGREVTIGAGALALYGVQTKADAAIRQVRASLALGRQHGPQLAVEQGAQQLQRFGAAARRRVVARQQPWAIGRQGGAQGIARGVQLADFARQGGGPVLAVGLAADQGRQPVGGTDLPPGGAAGEGDEQVVHEEAALTQSRLPAGVQVTADRVGKVGRQRHRDAASQDMMMDHIARGGDGLQRRVADGVAVIQGLRLGRFERQPRQMQALHQAPVLQDDGPLGVQADVRQPASFRGRRSCSATGASS
jgi:hypothetical protein